MTRLNLLVDVELTDKQVPVGENNDRLRPLRRLSHQRKWLQAAVVVSNMSQVYVIQATGGEPKRIKLAN